MGFLDLYALFEQATQYSKDHFPDLRLTDNGMHPTDFGYWESAPFLQANLKLPQLPWLIEMDARGKLAHAKDVKVEKTQTGPLRSGRDWHPRR